MKTADDLFNEAFDPPREKRSAAYKNGVMQALRVVLGEDNSPPLPYQLGTAEADAYFSGYDEGRSRGKDYLESIAPKAG